MEKDIELILINISGEDRPGLTSALTEILAKYEANILDIGQADIHHTLSLGILFKTNSGRSGDIMKELLFKASELNVTIKFTPISVDDYGKWVGMQGRNRYVITILARHITARQIASVTHVITTQGLNIDAIQRLVGVCRWRILTIPTASRRDVSSFQCEALRPIMPKCSRTS